MKTDYDNKQSRLVVEPSNVTSQEIESSNHAEETLIIIEKGDEGESERLLSFVIKLADSLLQAAKKRDRLTASLLVDFRADTIFIINMLRRGTKSPADCKYESASSTREL